MKDSQNIQASDSTAAAGVPSADGNPTVGQSAEMREFCRVFMLATPRSRKQICHLIQAYDAGNRRSVIEWAYHWAAFVAVNPRAALYVSPTLRRITRICIAVVAVGVMLALVTGCTGNSGGASSLRATAQAAGVVQAVDATQTPTDEPAQISATVTPDMQPQSIDAQPAQVIEVTPTAAVIATPTPQPVQIVAGIDESMQPCPVKYWRNGRCTATQAQIDAAASEVQP